jgi:hypothetical protein
MAHAGAPAAAAPESPGGGREFLLAVPAESVIAAPRRLPGRAAAFPEPYLNTAAIRRV